MASNTLKARTLEVERPKSKFIVQQLWNELQKILSNPQQLHLLNLLYSYKSLYKHDWPIDIPERHKNIK